VADFNRIQPAQADIRGEPGKASKGPFKGGNVSLNDDS